MTNSVRNFEFDTCSRLETKMFLLRTFLMLVRIWHETAWRPLQWIISIHWSPIPFHVFPKSNILLPVQKNKFLLWLWSRDLINCPMIYRYLIIYSILNLIIYLISCSTKDISGYIQLFPTKELWIKECPSLLFHGASPLPFHGLVVVDVVRHDDVLRHAHVQLLPDTVVFHAEPGGERTSIVYLFVTLRRRPIPWNRRL